MTKAIDHLAALTGFRDRDLLDVTLAHALMDLLRPRSVAVHKLVGEGGGEHSVARQRWFLRARLCVGDAVATSDPPWVEFDKLPERAAFARRCEALDSQQVLRVDDSPNGSLTIFPMLTDGDDAGVIEIVSSDPMSATSQRTISSILRIYRNFHALLDYSERDTLTGLLNRKTFDEAFLKTTHPVAPVPMGLASATSDDRRHEAPVTQHWLGVVDIDHFKNVNDRFGHLIGDEVLLLVARILRSTFRFQDRLYRFGGEEFVVLLRCATETDAHQAFERLRANMEAYAFPQVGHVTASVGYTAVQPSDTPSGAFERADQAVYHAKQHGRNQVCGHADLVRRGELHGGTKTGDVELF